MTQQKTKIGLSFDHHGNLQEEVQERESDLLVTLTQLSVAGTSKESHIPEPMEPNLTGSDPEWSVEEPTTGEEFHFVSDLMILKEQVLTV